MDSGIVGLTEIFIKIRTNFIPPETGVHAEQFCFCQRGSAFISFYAIVFEICTQKTR